MLTQKSNEDLAAMLARPELWSPEELAAIRDELQKRAVQFVTGHQLTALPVIVLILLHYVTCGIFSFVWLNLMHGRLPRIRPDDPSAGRAVGFMFIPFFNFYWIFFTNRRLCLRIDEQRELYGMPPSHLRALATVACIFQVIPYINLVFGYTLLWPIYIGVMQHSINQLVKQSATTAPQGVLQPISTPAPGMPAWAVILIICGCSIPFIAIMAAMLLPALAAAKAKAQEINCINNEKQLALGMLIYADKHQGHLPSAATWCDDIKTYSVPDRAFQCAATSTERCSYAFNSKLDGLARDSVNPQTVLIFESDSGWDASGGPDLLPNHKRHQHYIVAFADGSVRFESQAQFETERWDP